MTDDEMESRALHDRLTGLPNRTLFAIEVEAVLAPRGDGDTTQAAAVMLLDLDSLWEVNDRSWIRSDGTRSARGSTRGRA